MKGWAYLSALALLAGCARRPAPIPDAPWFPQRNWEQGPAPDTVSEDTTLPDDESDTELATR